MKLRLDLVLAALLKQTSPVATNQPVRRVEESPKPFCVLPKEEALCRERFYESCIEAVCFGSEALCNDLAPEEKWFLGLCYATEALAKVTNCKCICEDTVSNRDGAAHCYGEHGISVTKPVRGNCEAGGVCQPRTPLCELESYFHFMTLGYGVKLSYGDGSNWTNSLDYYGPNSNCTFLSDGKSNDAVVCQNANITRDALGHQFCDITFAGTNDVIDIVRYVLHLLAPNEGRTITFGSGDNEITFTALELLADIAFGADEHSGLDGIVEKAYQSAAEKGCFDRDGAAIHFSAHSLAAALANFFVLKLGAENPEVYVKMTTVGEPAVLINPLEGRGATLQAWSNKHRFLAGRVLPRGQVFNKFLQDRVYGFYQDYDWVAQVLPGGYVAKNSKTALSFLCEVKNGSTLEYFVGDESGCATGVDGVLNNLPDFPHKGGISFIENGDGLEGVLETVTNALDAANLHGLSDVINFLNVASTIADVNFRENFYQVFDIHFMRRPMHFLSLLYQNGEQCSATRRTIALPETSLPPDGSGAKVWWCFAEDNTVEEEDKGTITVKDLKVGDRVKTATGKFETVYSLGHSDARTKVQYLEIHASNLKPLLVSNRHLIFVNGSAVPASAVVVGDKVSMGEGRVAEVKKIGNVIRTGAYSPFTKSGTIMVNGVVASCYISLQCDSGVLMIGGRKTPVSFHWLARVFEAPHRLACMLNWGLCKKETYTKEGISNWVAGPLRFGSWLVEQDAVIMIVTFAPAFAFAFVFYAVESVLVSPALLLVAVVGVLFHSTRSRKKGKTA